MEILYSLEKSTLTIFLIGELDEFSAVNAKQKLDQIISDNKPQTILFDLSRLSFMDSTGIGVLIGRYKTAKALNGKVYVKNISRSIDKIFLMAGLYDIMPKISYKEQKNEIH